MFRGVCRHSANKTPESSFPLAVYFEGHPSNSRAPNGQTTVSENVNMIKTLHRGGSEVIHETLLHSIRRLWHVAVNDRSLYKI